MAAAGGGALPVAAGSVANGAAATLMAVAAGIFVAGKVGVRVGRVPYVGSGGPDSTAPTPYPTTSATTRVVPMSAQCVHGRLARAGTTFRMFMPLSPSLSPSL